MNKLLNVFLVILFLLGLLSCKNESINQSNYEIPIIDTISIDLKNRVNTISFSLDSSSNWFDFPITKNDKIEIDTNHIFIMYADSKGVNHFTVLNASSGLRTEPSINEGLKDFSIDTKNKRIGLLTKNGNIRIYDYKFNLLKNRSFKGQILEFSIFKNSIVLGVWPKKYTNNNTIVEVYDLKDPELINRVKLSNNKLRSKYRRVKQSISNHSSALAFTPFLSNNLFLIGVNSQLKKYYLNFNEHQIDLNLVSKTREDPYQFSIEKKWIYGIDAIYLTDDLIFLKIIKGTSIFKIVVDRFSLKVYTVRKMKNQNFHIISWQFLSLC